MFTLNLDIEGEGIHQGSNDSGHVFRTFNNRIFIILNTCGILSRGNFFIAEDWEDNCNNLTLLFSLHKQR